MAFTEPSGHWYRRDGTACHSVPMTTKAGNRPVKITDAIKLGLLPSVTTVLKTMDKPQLTEWKLRQVAIFSPQVPRKEGEQERAWVQRILQTAFAQVDEAADRGKDIHKALELHFGGEPYDDQWKVYVEAVDSWLAAHGVNVLARETNLVDLKHGFAGMADLIVGTSAGMGIGDYKTRKSYAGYPMEPYDDQPTQVAMYHMAQFGEIADNASGFNLFISTTEPGRVEGAFYEACHLRREWEVAEHLLAIWRMRHDYDPRTLAP